MSRASSFGCLLLACCFATAHAHAAAFLNDWCFNINGDSSSACNPVAASDLPPGVDASALDLTLNDPPGTANNLGSVQITLGPGSGQLVLAYFDYDVNGAAAGSFQDVGSVHGTLPSGFTYEMGDPSGAIFGDLLSASLSNMNSVSVGSAPPGPCCDVAWALGVTGLNVSSAREVVTFNVSALQPTSGFYLQQTNLVDGESIYFSANVSSVPEPPMRVLLVSALGSLMFLRFLQRAGGLTRIA